MIYRIGFIILALTAIGLGLVLGTLNSEPVVVDLLWLTMEWPLGLVMLTSLVLGLAIGMLAVWLTTVFPLKLKMRKLRGGSGSASDVVPGSRDG